MSNLNQILKSTVRTIPDFPIEGIMFRDISPILSDGILLREITERFVQIIQENNWEPELILGPESRGFIFGSLLASRLGIGFIPVRKPGKLPHSTIEIEYSLEYGTNKLEMHDDAISAGQKIIIIDDLLATGGTVEATAPALGDIISMPEMPEETLMAAFGENGMSAIGDAADQTSLGDFLLVMIAFLFVDIFDTSGTLYSVGRQAGYVDENDELHNSDEAFMADAGATIVGAILGTSTTTTYIESAAGVEDGGKTGLVAVTVGVLMLCGLLFTDLFAAVPQFAMASALVIVGAMMMRQAADIDWNDAEMSLPAFITIVVMPFTYSIADGIAWGIISWVAIKAGMGKFDEINKVMGVLAILMIMFYIGPGNDSTFGYLLDLAGF